MFRQGAAQITSGTNGKKRYRTPPRIGKNLLTLPRRPCFIHVGTHKTGTTSIQAFLRDNEARFAARGVAIPRAGRGEDAAGHHNLTQELLAGPEYRRERGGLAEVAAELRASTLPRACISSEDFALLSRSHDALVHVRDAVAAAGFTPVIVIYLRPQVAYCVAIYAEIVKNGNLKPFARYLDELREHGSFVWNGSLGPLCRYDIVLERFAAAFGRDALVVRRYRGGGRKNALLHSFAGIVIGRPARLRGFVFPPERYNPTLSFGRVLAALGAPPPAIDMRFAPLTLAQTFELTATFTPANIAVARRYGTWIPACESGDLLLAQPLRKTRARTRALAAARAALDGDLLPSR